MVIAWLLGLLGAIFYGTFLEWFIHRYGMHTDRISKWAFQRHAIEHHSTRRSLKAFYIEPEEHAFYSLAESSAVPILWAVHFPIYYLVYRIWGLQAAIGTAVGAALYILAYEVIHFFIHAPKNYWFQRTRLFRFYCEYHRVHHHKARYNYNVVMPLADLLLGTLRMEELRPEPSAPNFVKQDTGPLSVFRKKTSV